MLFFSFCFCLHRYQDLMSPSRAGAMIGALWLLALLCGFSDFFSPISVYSSATSAAAAQAYNYCELIWLTAYQEEYSVLVIAFVCLFVMLFIYIRIYLIVRRHKTPGDWALTTQNNKLEAKKNRRALVTTLLILGSFIFCWLPTCLFQIVMMLLVATGTRDLSLGMINILRSADKYLLNLFLLNCLCDPIIYTVRCKEVRVGYRKLWFSWCRGKERNSSCPKSAKSSLASASSSSTGDKQTSGSGHTLLRETGSGHRLLRETGSGHRLLRETGSGHRLLKETGSGHRLLREAQRVRMLTPPRGSHGRNRTSEGFDTL